ncbi:MAG: hypothetical protein M5U01_15935 [Ardenticatenaceae bacterium]|nr:hypothetical protein [Ardenticatenaceae bacterium]
MNERFKHSRRATGRQGTAGRKLATEERLEQLNCYAAGLEVGLPKSGSRCPQERGLESVQVSNTCTADLHAAADWLAAYRMETGVIESTGISWVLLSKILRRAVSMCI